jgi:NADPH-dependent 2,4-dienoyl-CoA reductase/sulfur reductase-like enzyme
MTCYINPECAHEWDERWKITEAETDKIVMIVGAGPAGLETAWTAARRGHEVHVYDRRDRLGGQLIEASKAPYGDEELYYVVDFQKAQCEKAGVEFHLGQEVTPDLIEEEMPDAVVLASGAEFVRRDAPGLDGPNVVSARDVLNDEAEVGARVVVVGGRKPGIATAFHLARQGKKVTLVSSDRKVGKDVNPSFVWRYIGYLRENKVQTYNECEVAEFSEGEVAVLTHYGTRIPVPADTVVYADRASCADLKEAVKKNNIELHVIGDALVPRTSSNAVHDGYRTGIRI